MANAWLAHVKKTKELNPHLMQNGGLKAVIFKAKETYKKQKQSGGSGNPMGGTVETMVEQGADVAGAGMGRAVGAGAQENVPLSDAHIIGGGKKKANKSNKAKKSKKSKTAKKAKKAKKTKKAKKSKKSKKANKTRSRK